MMSCSWQWAMLWACAGAIFMALVVMVGRPIDERRAARRRGGEGPM